MVVDSSGEFMPSIGRINRKVRMATVDKHSCFNFLHLDAEERLEPIGERPACIEYIVDQHNTFFPEAFEIAVDGNIALLRSQFVEGDLYQLYLQWRYIFKFLYQRFCQHIPLAVDPREHQLFLGKIVFKDLESHPPDLLLHLAAVEYQAFFRYHGSEVGYGQRLAVFERGEDHHGLE